MDMFSPQTYRVFAEITLGVHLAYVLFVVGGLVLIWIGWMMGWSFTRNPYFRWAHIVAIAFVVIEEAFGIRCPLITLEYYFFGRARVDAPPLEKTLIMRLFESVLYYRLPDAFFTFLYYFFGAIIFMTFFFHPPRLRKPPRMRGAKRRCKKILSPR